MPAVELAPRRSVALPRGAHVHGHVEQLLRPLSSSSVSPPFMPSSIGVAVIVAGGAALARAS
eukprot:5719743-Heterocapsa_arctica.AAC.1